MKLKALFLTFLFFLISILLKATDPEITYTMSEYQGGNNVSCHNATDGFINVVVVGGVSPYFFSWSNGAFTQNLSNIGPGNYTVTITDYNGITASTTITIKQSNTLTIDLVPTLYEGQYHISESGGSNGYINTSIGGGVMPYTYLWSNNDDKDGLVNVPAGYYNVIVSDMNGCSVTAGMTLLEPSPLHVVSIVPSLNHGFNTSCYGKPDGTINLTVIGGVLPYTYQWSNGQFTEDLTDLPAGHYTVIIRDANDAATTAQITLNQPPTLQIALTPSIFPNGKNISCYGCNNGTLSSLVSGGVSPYSYTWSNAITSSSISGLTSGDYWLSVVDANGCIREKSIGINAPDREDWSLNGTPGTDPNSQYLGTSDTKDLVIKANGTEQLRIKSSGGINLSSLSGTGVKLVSTDALGNLSRSTLITHQSSSGGNPSVYNFGGTPVSSPTLCTTPQNYPSNYQFNGMLQSYGNSASGNQLNMFAAGFDGQNGIIDVLGQNSGPLQPRLLINHYCGADVFVGSNNSGNLTALHNFFTEGRATIGSGSNSFTEKLDIVNGNIFVHGINNFTQSNPNDEAIVYLGNRDHYIKSIYGKGITIGTSDGGNSSIEVINIEQVSGKVGIGTSQYASDSKLTVNGNVHLLNTATPIDGFQIVSGRNPLNRGIRIDGAQDENFDFYIADNQNGGFHFINRDATTNTNFNLLTINHDGGVSVAGGTNDIIPNGYQLAVHGKIICEEVTVMLESQWPDFVFNSKYKLPKLNEVKKYIDSNKHLAGVPTAEEIKNDGLTLSEMIVIQMQKIEELTLYVISLQEQIDELNKSK
jgi:hypothetical protein